MKNLIVKSVLSLVLTASAVSLLISPIMESSTVVQAGLWKPLIAIMLLILMSHG